MVTLVDRLVTLLVGVVLAGLGLLAVLAPAGGLNAFDVTVNFDWLEAARGADWWTWAVGGAGVGLTVLAACWLLAHLPRRPDVFRRIREPGDHGCLAVDLSSVLTAAAEELDRVPAIRQARGRVVVDRGTRLAELRVTVENPGDVEAATTATDEVSRQIVSVSEDPELAVRAVIALPKLATGRRRLE
ncbi:hypothetical protein BVC93_04475 [Mycobacterium sp. MS1601]|uniref:hypothetical protein n=1 Tax=Mycobacterium sp. MS1601 TaxID=1936029 RepID=UPI0009795687|nr:hypothetical protein [Mycobacterium sp. MS1601]AQA01817.1 hypothetical protein BVC93_04475 [Mycobacterium sp. MS1601]